MEHLVKTIYVYCTDFIINFANIVNWSYYEVNTLIFCILYLVLLIGLTGIYLIQKSRLKKLKANINIEVV